MAIKLGRQNSNRTVYDAGDVASPASCVSCPELKLQIATVDKLAVELKDKHLTAKDIAVIALRTCARINDSLPEEQRTCRLTKNEPPRTIADNLPQFEAERG